VATQGVQIFVVTPNISYLCECPLTEQVFAVVLKEIRSFWRFFSLHISVTILFMITDVFIHYQ